MSMIMTLLAVALTSAVSLRGTDIIYGCTKMIPKSNGLRRPLNLLRMQEEKKIHYTLLYGVQGCLLLYSMAYYFYYLDFTKCLLIRDACLLRLAHE